MDSIKLAARCYQKGLISKEAMADVLRTRDRLIKEAIATRIGAKLMKGKSAGGFMGRMKKSLGMGGLEKATKGKEGQPGKGLEWAQTVGNLVKLLGAGAALQGGAAGMQGILRHRKDSQIKDDIQSSFGKMMVEHPKLQEMDRGKVSRHFGVLARYAPSLAADPIVAGSWVANATLMGHIDPGAIKQLSDTQTAIDRAHESRSLTQPGQFSKGLALAQTAMG